MEPEVDGKPLLPLNDLEARLVFTRCKVSERANNTGRDRRVARRVVRDLPTNVYRRRHDSAVAFQPFTLNTPDRHWVFAGDLSRVEGRSVRSYWALLFSDILLFTKVSRDRVLFVTDEPLPLSSIVQTQFSVKKKGTPHRSARQSSATRCSAT